jgi:hypothetical protein
MTEETWILVDKLEDKRVQVKFFLPQISQEEAVPRIKPMPPLSEQKFVTWQ